MKTFTLILTMLILMGTAASVSATSVEVLPRVGFALDIVGTAHFEDIDLLKKGMTRAEGAEGVRVTRSSHNFTRIRGTFQGKREHFERDLADDEQRARLVLAYSHARSGAALLERRGEIGA